MKLLLGSGGYTRPGYTTVDILALPTVDIVADLNKPLPIPDNSVDEIVADCILEHLDDTVAVMEELYRVCKNDAKVRIKVPYFKSTAMYKIPTHVSFFTEHTFDYFTPEHPEREQMAGGGLQANFRVHKLHYLYYTRGTRFIPFVGLLRRFLWDIVKSLVFELRAVKPGAPKAEL